MDKTTSAHPVEDPGDPAYMTRTDPVWIALFIAVIVINIWFGIHSLTQAQRVEMTRRNAEAVMAWLTEKASLREQRQSVSEACDASPGSWNECLNSLIGAQGALPNVRNELLPSAPVFAEACDRGEPQSLGSIVIEKGTPKPVDPSSISYAKMPKDQDLSQKLLLRVRICGRSFHVMNIGETAF